jgi:ACS family hexuronate transporter-like MFS transporter
MAGALAATLFAVLVGLVLEHMKTYAPILIFCGGAYIIAWLVLHILVPKIRPISMS